MSHRLYFFVAGFIATTRLSKKSSAPTIPRFMHDYNRQRYFYVKTIFLSFFGSADKKYKTIPPRHPLLHIPAGGAVIAQEFESPSQTVKLYDSWRGNTTSETLVTARVMGVSSFLYRVWPNAASGWTVKWAMILMTLCLKHEFSYRCKVLCLKSLFRA